MITIKNVPVGCQAINGISEQSFRFAIVRDNERMHVSWILVKLESIFNVCKVGLEIASVIINENSPIARKVWRVCTAAATSCSVFPGSGDQQAGLFLLPIDAGHSVRRV